MQQVDVLILGIMFATQLGLILMEILGARAFGFLIIILSAAGLSVSAGISNVAGIPGWLNAAGWCLGWLQVMFGLILIVFGRNALSGRSGRH